MATSASPAAATRVHARAASAQLHLQRKHDDAQRPQLLTRRSLATIARISREEDSVLDKMQRTHHNDAVPHAAAPVPRVSSEERHATHGGRHAAGDAGMEDVIRLMRTRTGAKEGGGGRLESGEARARRGGRAGHLTKSLLDRYALCHWDC